MKRRVRKSRNNSKKKFIYYGIAGEALKQQFSDLSEDLSTCEEDSEADSTVTGSLSGAELLASEDFRSSLLVGDVIWSKFSGQNWWPSMVAYDPNSAVYFQTSAKYPNIPLKYHVQFFGEKALRGWVAKSNILKFQGRQHFTNSTCNNSPSSSQREIWDEAVWEAEEAVLLDRKERKLAYVFNYQGKVSKERRRKSHKKGIATKINKKVPISAYVERRKSSRLNTPSIQKKEVKLPPADSNFEPHNTRQSARLSIADSSNVTVTTVKTNSPVKFVNQELEPYKTHTHSIVTSDDSVANVDPVVRSTSVLQDISWVNSDLLNDSAYPNAENNLTKVAYPDVENSSDSGIEDIETLESSSDDMDSLGLKRKRKPKVFEGFHTGDEIIDAFKSKPKVKVAAKGNDKETEINKKSEKENVMKSEKENVIADDESDVVVNTAIKSKKAKHKSPKKCTEPNQKVQNNDTSIAEKADVTSSCENENLTMNLEYFSTGRHSKRKCSEVKKDVETTTSTTDEDDRPSKKAKQDISVTNTAKKVIYTKIKDCNIEKNKPVISLPGKSSTTSGSEEDTIDNSIKTNQKEDAVIDSTKLKRDPKDQFCIMCEDVNGDLISCSGTCLNQFHANCLGLNFMPTNSFTCDECTTGYHTCFVCRKAGELKKCSQNTCGKYYHTQCLENNTLTKFENKSKDKFTCPLHVCRYCSKNKSLKMTSGKRLLRCVRCTAAYHQGVCIPAGCLALTLNHMICDEHFEPTKSSGQTHVNTTWCFICSLGGSLVCCDTCPASFHAECSDDLTGVPEGAWRCPDCRNGNKLRYGDIVWVKYSIYRWWPGRICLPEEVPVRIQNLPHAVGEFPVLFFGSRDYCWLSAGVVFKYVEGDMGTSSSKSYLAKYFQKALEEAKEAFTEVEKRRVEQIQAFDKKQSNKPPSYGHIKVNRPVTCIQTVLDRSEWPICQCKADDPCKNECLNKMLYYECNPLQCPNRENCKNQRMQKSQYARTQIFKCEGKGWGLKSNQEIKTGDFVIEYVGELIDEATCRKRIQQYHEKDIYDYYFLTIDKDNIIDAFPKGNLSRFMNHSCDPNCETQKWTVSGEVRVGLFATRDIVVGEELSFNYNLDCLGNEKKQCKCGSANCSGFLGVQPKTQHSIYVAEKAKKLKEKTTGKRKLKRKRKTRIVHDDECFSCGDGGELICCDRVKCTKAYHPDCLIMDEPPRGKWDCPWHFCDECGKIARSMCSLCPNSFCESHLDGQMIELKEDVIVCPVHDEEEMEKLKKEKVDQPDNQEKKNMKDVESKFNSKKKKTSKPHNRKLKGVSVKNISSLKSVKKTGRKQDLDSLMQNVESKAVESPSSAISPTCVFNTTEDTHNATKIPGRKSSKSKTKKSSSKKKNGKKEVAKKTNSKKETKKSSTKKIGIGGKRKYLMKATQKAGTVKSTNTKSREEVAVNTNQKTDVIESINGSEAKKDLVKADQKTKRSTSNGSSGQSPKDPKKLPKSSTVLINSTGKNRKKLETGRKKLGRPSKKAKKNVGQPKNNRK